MYINRFGRNAFVIVFLMIILFIAPQKGGAQPATGSVVRNIFVPADAPAMAQTDSNIDNETNVVAPAPMQRNSYSPRTESTSVMNGDVETITVNGVSFNIIHVKGGSFRMGGTEEQGSDVENNEMPVHNVSVGDFCIGETEVTQELWEAVMGGNPSKTLGPQMPVECIRYVDCESFFFKLNFLTNRNFRLPTEAEWEFAARGGNKSRHTKYSGSDDFDAVAWYCNNSGNVTHNVKQKAPNELGLYDMSGNVDEWCADSYSLYPETPRNNPINNEGNEKIRRGGGCLDFAKHLRVSDRRSCSATIWNYDIGFRLAE